MCTNTYIFMSKRKNGKKDRVILAKKKKYIFFLTSDTCISVQYLVTFSNNLIKKNLKETVYDWRRKYQIRGKKNMS